MSFEGYPKMQPREEYSGMWGRIGFLLSRRSVEELLNEVNDKDSVWRAAAWMQGRKRDMDYMDELSEIEIDGWYLAITLATEHTEQQWIKNETDDDVLRAIIEREAETGNVDTDRIALLNKRRQELRM